MPKKHNHDMKFKGLVTEMPGMQLPPGMLMTGKKYGCKCGASQLREMQIKPDPNFKEEAKDEKQVDGKTE